MRVVRERREAACVKCGQTREIAAYGLCFTCYRSETRAKNGQIDRHNPGIRREHKRLFRGFTNVMAGLSDLGVQRSDVLAIRQMLEPYVSPIREFLAASRSSEQLNTNSKELFTPFTKAED
jgi:hypothetical protein